MTAFKLTEVRGNIFNAPRTFSLACPISSDLKTVKGTLAWHFSLIFGPFDGNYLQHIAAGTVAVIEDTSRFIYLLVTKTSLYGHSIYSNIGAALICLRGHMRQHEVLKVAMPRIGCGNDQLDWQRVKIMIHNIFAKEYLVEMVVYEHVTPLPITPRCNVIEVTGNIFSTPADVSLAHSVSADFSLCHEIGLQFKCKFGQISDLLRQNKHTGEVAVLRDNERYIYNLVTKERSHEKCTYPALYYALVAMREHMRQHIVTKVAVPRLGCGIDHLNWCRVKQILEYVFAEDIVEIIAYLYKPRSSSNLSDHGQCSTCKRPY